MQRERELLYIQTDLIMKHDECDTTMVYVINRSSAKSWKMLYCTDFELFVLLLCCVQMELT